MSRHPLPLTGTYRLQLRKGFGFAEARALVSYLDELGISHAYASPYLSARAGSSHGYDLVDPRTLNPELGTDDDHRAWVSALEERRMGHIVDFVPNHMSVATENAWWCDVLENGPSSLHAERFDIEWHPHKAALENKVLLPILGAQYGEVLESGELRLERREGAFFVRYWEHALPANPRSTWPLLERALARLPHPADAPSRLELESIVTGLRNLPARTETDPARRRERAREKEVAKRRLAMVAADPEVAKAIDAEVENANGRPGDPRSFDELDRILMEQSYRLAFWRVATEEINYRRFFDINDLAAVRMESDEVFDDAHALLLRLVAEGAVQGVRLDHTDGLYDPAEYFARLRRAMKASGKSTYLVAEKILSATEPLPPAWEIDGTTGYDFLAQATGVFVERSSERSFTRLHQEITGDMRTFAEHARDAKRAIMRSSLSSEIYMLATRLERIAMRDRRSRDFTFATLRRALSETIAAFPVYRTYIRPDGSRTPEDEHIVTSATRLARKRNTEVSASVFDFLRDVLLLRRPPIDEEDRAARTELAMRFQQLTGPVMAKSVEDTAFYTYVRFTALNEVGGSPDRFGTTTAELHAANAARLARWPFAMTTTGTHDTKRGEDVRARLAVLSEMPDAWEIWVREWSELVAPHVRTIDDEEAPSAVDRYLFFQTALGACPFEGVTGELTTRLAEVAVKAAREAKQRTSWLVQDEAYEEALRAFVVGAMNDRRFVSSLEAKLAEIAVLGASNGLGQAVLQLASPGVADRYQGSELWDLRLVDPDNRGPVDYEARRSALRSLEGATVEQLRETFADGRLKLHVVRQGLLARRELPEIFLRGEYTPIDAGPEVVAFSRTHVSGSVVCAVTCRPRAITRTRGGWPIGKAWGERTIAVPEGRWRDVLSGLEHGVPGHGLAASQLFAELPVALLISRR
ncbi:MAG: malto-oligosyltrehalose synthase [Deltaproteobacteria bacterium]|nr:malto-oligosyltrehalose synthase [Deltaproteobacteria bacterium]